MGWMCELRVSSVNCINTITVDVFQRYRIYVKTGNFPIQVIEKLPISPVFHSGIKWPCSLYNKLQRKAEIIEFHFLHISFIFILYENSAWRLTSSIISFQNIPCLHNFAKLISPIHSFKHWNCWSRKNILTITTWVQKFILKFISSITITESANIFIL